VQSGWCADGTFARKGSYGNILVSSRWPVVSPRSVQRLAVLCYYSLMSALYL
jgi:hypothetical protein